MNEWRRRLGSILLALCAGLGWAALGVVSLTHARLSEPDGGAGAPAVYVPLIARLAPFPNCRFGVGNGGQLGYEVASLNMGWYLDWHATLTPTHPNQAEYVQVIRLSPAFGGYTFSPLTSTVYAIAAANPGATWLIGNEPDSPFQDNLTPEVYARAYHHLYHLVKGYDPGARVGAGGIVQPTPIRFEYIDRVWASYLAVYGQPQPADVWNIHSYILREITPDDPEAVPHGPLDVWGAYIPPGIPATRGELYNYSDQDDLAIFHQRIVDFRVWMRDHGQRDKPLLITEYGMLFPEDYFDEKGIAFSQERAAAFMRASFDLLLNARDESIGNPLDDDRLVQRWAWYSLDNMNLGGALFDPFSGVRRLLGDAYAAYTGAITPFVDLSAVFAYAAPAALMWTGQPVTASLRATFSNPGNILVTQSITVTFWDAPPGVGAMIGRPQVLTTELAGCGDAATAEVAWPMPGVGRHSFYAEVDSGQAVSESNEGNNVVAGSVLVATSQVFLPALLRSP